VSRFSERLTGYLWDKCIRLVLELIFLLYVFAFSLSSIFFIASFSNFFTTFSTIFSIKYSITFFITLSIPFSIIFYPHYLLILLEHFQLYFYLQLLESILQLYQLYHLSQPSSTYQSIFSHDSNLTTNTNNPQTESLTPLTNYSFAKLTPCSIFSAI
jgi:hypothetical protein